ncbi:MAG: VanZ family protein [Lachnospiraceae bacterium]|nr:VanZ family protein [Lachnospiraceae bacterium]
MIKRTIAVVLTIIWMLVIFAYSSKSAEASTGQSLRLGRALFRLVISDWNELRAAEKQSFAERWDHPIRKTAHVTEFAILGILLTNVFLLRKTKKQPAAMLSLFCGIVYAASDELHQTFVPGRAGMFGDVCIDACGVVIGTALFIGIYALTENIRAGKAQKASVKGDYKNES